MEDSWRFRPPPPAFDDLPRFRPDFDPYFARQFPLPRPLPPFPDPAIHHHHHHPWDLRHGPFHPVHPPPQTFPSDGFMDHGGFNKRMRVGDLPPGSFAAPPQLFDRLDPDPRGMASEDERRLNLIHDHGRRLGPPFGAELQRHANGDYGAHGFHGPTGQCWSIGADARFSNGRYNHHPSVASYGDGYQDSIVPIDQRRDVGVAAMDPRAMVCAPLVRGPSRLDERPWNDHRFLDAVPGSDHVFLDARRSLHSFESQKPQSLDNPSRSFLELHQHPFMGSHHLDPGALNREGGGSLFPEHKLKLHLEGNLGGYEGGHANYVQSAPDFNAAEPMPNLIDPERAHPDLYDHSDNRGRASSTSTQANRSLAYPPLAPQTYSANLHEPLPPLPPFQVASSSSLSTQPPVQNPVLNSASASTSLFTDPYLCPSSQAAFRSEPLTSVSTSFATEESPLMSHLPSDQYPEETRSTFPTKKSSNDKPMVTDVCQLFKQPHRSSRPDHFVIILRGLPGSGKSYIAKMLRDIEVENGGSIPRVHAMDDYFMIEVEKKVEENEVPKAPGLRGKKQGTKKVIEYCYEPEMEEVYRSSMLKAFKKTLEDGNFTFVIVDDRNLRVADFAQFWAVAKRSGYEVFLLEATYKDPTGCAARNVHGFTPDDIQKMADQWEDAPPLYFQLDIQSLFHGDGLSKDSIQEVDMDMDDSVCDEDDLSQNQTREDNALTEPTPERHVQNGSRDINEEREEGNVKELGKSKWSKDLDDLDEHLDSPKASLNSAISGLIQAYSNGQKSVHWGDQAEKGGFSIGAAKKQISSLVIGPGSGYNSNTNPPFPEEEVVGAAKATGSGRAKESKGRFNEQLRAERESFKAVFDRRRQRLGVLSFEDDDE